MALTVPFAQMFISRFAELTTLGKTNIRPIGFALIEIRSVKGPKSGVIDHACGSAGRVPVGGRPFVERVITANGKQPANNSFLFFKKSQRRW